MMTNGSRVYFVDTNVFVYAYDARDQAKRERAIAVLDRLTLLQSGTASVQVLKEFCSVILRQYVQAVADIEEIVRGLVASWTIFDVGSRDVLEALAAVGNHRMAFYDALIMVTARDNGAHYILSEDGQSAAQIDGVRYLNPFAPGFDLARLA